MASYYPTLQVRIAQIREATSVDQLTKLIKKYPETILSKDALAELMRVLPNIIHRTNHKNLDYHFIGAVIDAHRAQEKGKNPETLSDFIDHNGGYSNHDYALHIIRYYVQIVVAETNGQCLGIESVSAKYPFDEMPFSAVGHLEYVGLVFLLAKYDENDSITKAIHDLLIKDHPEAIEAFLNVMVDLSCMDGGNAPNLLSQLWVQFSSDPDKEWTYLGTFVAQCMKRNIGWMQEHVQELYVNGERPSQADVEKCTDLFVMLSNVFDNQFARENYFFEYIAEIAGVYPLIQERLDIADRYSKYFGEDAILYMADFSNEVLTEFSSATSYQDPRVRMDILYNAVHKKAEAIILEIHRNYPDVPARVIELFFDDTCKAFGRGFSGASIGAMLVISPMIDEIIKKDQTVLESEFDCISLINALEGSYDTEDITKSDSGNGGSGSYGSNSNSNDTGGSYQKSLHRKSNAKKTSDGGMDRAIANGYRKYKDNERKVDETLDRGIATVKKAIVGDQQAVLIEGKKFSAVGFLKKVLATVAIFSYSKIAALLTIIVTKVMKSKSKKNEKRALLQELSEELDMVNEKIEDARGDGNRQAKYDLMRTRNALQNAIQRLKYGMGAEEKDKSALKDAIAVRDEVAQQRQSGDYSG